MSISEAVVVVCSFRNAGGVALAIVWYKAVRRGIREITNRHSLVAECTGRDCQEVRVI
jgi:hypothetical protein